MNMKVYRFLSAKELEKIQSGEVDDLGTDISCIQSHFYTEKDGDTVKYPNTHKYKPGTKYLHFFLNKKACQHMIDFSHSTTLDDGTIKDFYIATFNIPITRLIKSSGKGYYVSEEYKYSSGYDYINTTTTRREFAIETSAFDPNWLCTYEPAKTSTKRENNGTAREL